MNTCQQYVDEGPNQNNEYWINGLDLLSHCLKADHQNTLYKSGNIHPCHYRDLQDGLEQRAKRPDDYQDAINNFYNPQKKWVTEKTKDGTLSVNSYLNRTHSVSDMLFTKRKKRIRQKPALNILFDAMVPYCEREKDSMEARHKEIYQLVMQAMSARRPVRVIAISNTRIDEISDDTIKVFTVIKDFTDPIFPAIWGALMSNSTANDFLNVALDYFVGTCTSANGSPKNIDVSPYFDRNAGELILCQTDRLTDGQ